MPAPERAAGTARLLPGLLVLALAAGGGYLGGWLALRGLAGELAARPPLVIVELAGGPGGAAPEALAARLARRGAAARRLAAAGFLVLDAQAVLAAPPDLYLPGAAPAGPPP